MSETTELTLSKPVEHVRFDRNLAHNALDFNKQFGEDGQLIFDMMLYIAYSYDRNLFGYGKFDPHDFAQKMGYKTANLMVSHKDPRQLANDKEKRKQFEKLKKQSNDLVKVSGNEKEAFFYTALDNAFYRALSENLVFSFAYKRDNETVSELAALGLITRVAKHYTDEDLSKTKRSKLYYTYTVNKEFENNLTKFFLQVDLFSSQKLRKSGSVYLYSYLKNLQMTLHGKGEHDTLELNFDMLTKLAQISVASPSEAKRKLQKKINLIFRETDLKGEFKYVKRPGDRFVFQPYIKFFNNMPKLHSKEYFEQVQSAVWARFKHEAKALYRAKGGSKKLNLGLGAWIKQAHNLGKGEDYVALWNCYKSCYKHVCPKDRAAVNLDVAASTGLSAFVKSISKG